MAMILISQMCHQTLVRLTMLVLVFLITACQCPQTQPLIIMGTLSSDDVEQIVRLVRSDLSGISPDQLPDKHRNYEPINILRENPDGTVDASTGVQRGGLSGAGHTYKIHKGPKGWEIKSKSQWLSKTPQPLPQKADAA